MFFGRRINGRISSAYNPTTALNAILDCIAQAGSVTLGTPPDITHWADSSPFGNTLVQLDDNFPDYQATAWNGGTPAIDFTGTPFFRAATGTSVPTAFDGSRAPKSVVARVKFDATGQQTLCAWESSGSAKSLLGISSSGKLQYLRQPNSGVPEQVSSIENVGTGRVTVGFSFESSGDCTIYLDGQPKASATFSANPCTFGIFKVGSGPLTPSDAVDGQLKRILVSPRAISPAEHLQVHNYLVATYT